jgi:plasmid rolling circle replication initiator protein Rep
MNYNINSLLDEHDFRDKKRLQESILEKYQYFNEKKTNAIIDCARYLEFGLYQSLSDKNLQNKKLDRMYTCRDRFCPFCNWRRARKLAIQSYGVLKAIEADKKVRYLFVTLTVKNCPIEQLSGTIGQMNKAYEKMFRWQRLKKSVLGWSRILEYPPQKNNPSMIHPHYHCLICVSTSYFRGDKDLYIKQDEWKSLWQKALNIDYVPSVDVRIIKAKKGGDPIAKAVAEFAKYPLKTADIKPMSVDQFQELVNQMKKKRVVAFGGILKEYRKKLALDSVEDGDLIYNSLENIEQWKKIATLIYLFQVGEHGLDYYLEEISLENGEY